MRHGGRSGKTVTLRLKSFSDELMNADEVYVAGEFNLWLMPQGPYIFRSKDFKMRKENEHWVIQLRLKPGKYEFKFVVDGRKWIPYSPQLKKKPRSQGSLPQQRKQRARRQQHSANH